MGYLTSIAAGVIKIFQGRTIAENLNSGQIRGNTNQDIVNAVYSTIVNQPNEESAERSGQRPTLYEKATKKVIEDAVKRKADQLKAERFPSLLAVIEEELDKIGKYQGGSLSILETNEILEKLEETPTFSVFEKIEILHVINNFGKWHNKGGVVWKNTDSIAVALLSCGFASNDSTTGQLKIHQASKTEVWELIKWQCHSTDTTQKVIELNVWHK